MPSGRVVGIDSPAGLERRIRPLRRIAESPILFTEGKSGPRIPPNLTPIDGVPWENGMSGTQRSVVILVSFTDQPSSTPVSQWTGSYFGTTDSVADYFDEVSYGNLDIAPAFESHGAANDGVVGWLNVGYDHPGLAAGCLTDPNVTCSGADHRELAADAMRLADPYVHFGLYDANGDGYLTPKELHIVIVAAGNEASVGDHCSPAVWAHRSGLTNDDTPLLDGVWVGWEGASGGYTMIGERHCRQSSPPGAPATMGVMVHEMGHDLGWPDLYDTYGAPGSVGAWSVMGTGGWLGPQDDGTVPAHPDAFAKWYQGWLTPLALNGTEPNLAVVAAATSPTAVQLLDNPGGVDWRQGGDPGSGEYFLVENRQQVGYDAFLPGCGLLVWHVDESTIGASVAKGDELGSRLLRLLDADGLRELDRRIDLGDPGDAWPGNSGATRFGPSTNPSNRLYSGALPGAGMRVTSTGCLATMTADFTTDGFLDAGGHVHNDSFGDAATLDSLPLVTELDSTTATTESGEPTAPAACELTGRQMSGTLWYRLSPGDTIEVGADTLGSDFDTVLAVHRGNSLGSLTTVACSDDIDGPGDNLLSRVRFTALAGQTYWLQVGGGGIGPDTVGGKLRLTVGEVPGNDDFAGAAPVAANSPVIVDNTGAGVEADENVRPDGCGFIISSIGRTLWFRHTATASGRLTVDTGGSHPDTAIAAYTGNSLANLTEIGCNDDQNDSSLRSSLTIDATAGTTYRFQVGGWAGRLTSPETGRIVFNVNQPPAGDSFASPVPLISGTERQSTHGATSETDEPIPSCVSQAGATVWYQLTAIGDGRVALSTVGSSYDTVLAVYSGSSLTDLTELQCSDDAGTAEDRLASRVAFDVAAGQTFWVQIAGYDGQSGELVLSATMPLANDAVASPATIGGLPFADQTSTVTATTEPGEDTSPAMCALAGGGSIGRTLWYRYQPATTSDVVVNTIGSDFDTVLAVWRGSTLQPVACNDDIRPGGAQPELRSRVEFTARAGQTYYLQVGGYNGSYGSLTVSMRSIVAPPGITILSPAAGATVQADATILAESTGTVTGVQFEIDGSVIGVDSQGADGWQWLWRTDDHSNGSHTITVRATNDTAVFQSIDVVVDNPGPVVRCKGLAATIVGTAGNDILTGTPGADVIHGLGGNDNIQGAAGDDVICGGIGDDAISGGHGDDTIAGEPGNDLIFGDDGDDILLGGLGDDRMLGGRGNDLLRGHVGNDESWGGPGNDRLQDGPGNDFLGGDEGKDKLWGGRGDDRLSGDSGPDQLRAGPGDDVLIGGRGTDRMWGEAGADFLSGGTNSDFLYGGINPDELWGDAGNDRIFGWTGNDELRGGAGRDQLRGQAGDDLVDGGADRDWCSPETEMVSCEKLL